MIDLLYLPKVLSDLQFDHTSLKFANWLTSRYVWQLPGVKKTETFALERKLLSAPGKKQMGESWLPCGAAYNTLLGKLAEKTKNRIG